MMNISILLMLKLLYGCNQTITFTAPHHTRKIKDMTFGPRFAFFTKYDLDFVIFFFGYHLLMNTFYPITTTKRIFKRAIIEWIAKNLIEGIPAYRVTFPCFEFPFLANYPEHFSNSEVS